MATSQAAQAEQQEIIQTRDSKIAEIEGYQDLTQEAKDRRINEVRQWAAREVRSIQEYDQQKIEKEFTASRDAVFNVPVSPTYSDSERSLTWQAFRSAWAEVSSVSKVKSKDEIPGAVQTLERILEDAERFGDEHLGHAVFVRATDLATAPIVGRSAQALVERYLATRPRVNKAWQRYTRAVQEMNASRGFEHLLADACTERQLKGEAAEEMGHSSLSSSNLHAGALRERLLKG